MDLTSLSTPSSQPLTGKLDNTVTFHCGAAHEEILRLDDKGMTYLGKRIEDAGEAHRAFLETLSRMNLPVRT